MGQDGHDITEANVTVMISDMNRSVKFYVETLALRLKSRHADQFAQVEGPGLTIALHPAVARGPRPGNSESLSVGLGVADVESAMAKLKGKGVSFSRVSNDGRSSCVLQGPRRQPALSFADSEVEVGGSWWGRPDLNRGSQAPKATSLDELKPRPDSPCSPEGYSLADDPNHSALRPIR